MHKACRVLRGAYFDSVVLMGAAARIKSRDGVGEAAFFMGTPANRKLLAAVGMAAPEIGEATAADTVLCVEATDAAVADAALDDAVAALLGRKQAADAGEPGRARPRGLAGALREAQARGGANLALISLPGRYVESEAMRALKRGLNVFIFSDNVPLDAEVRLKSEAVARDLLCMGPDCGTAWLGGVGLGFSNAVPRGRVGIISASGTGLQAVACMLAAAGEGVSHGIGVGGRDLSREVEGRMTLLALRRLQQDAGTEAIVIVSKPPAPQTLRRLDDALASVDKPVVIACLGAAARAARHRWVSTLADAVGATVAILRGSPWQAAAFSDPGSAREVVARAGTAARGRTLLGLYTGGTLAHEAELVVQPFLGEVAYGDEDAIARGRHGILDLGDDRYTQGRPHPMIDPQPRAELLLGRGGAAGVVLFDLVLGRCSHPDPAEPLAGAMTALRHRLGTATPAFVGAVVGTDADPQNRTRQEARLRDAGAIVLPDNAQAARLAALLVAPERAGALLAA